MSVHFETFLSGSVGDELVAKGPCDVLVVC